MKTKLLIDITPLIKPSFANRIRVRENKAHILVSQAVYKQEIAVTQNPNELSTPFRLALSLHIAMTDRANRDKETFIFERDDDVILGTPVIFKAVLTNADFSEEPVIIIMLPSEDLS